MSFRMLLERVGPGVLSLCVAWGVCAVCVEPSGAEPPAGPWQRHTIDRSSRGADGVKLMDVNGDHLPDAVTGWEEGGQVRACLHPGYAKVRQVWPSVTVAKVGNLEDAVFADLDGDGAVDVVSAAEGGTRQVALHWAPRHKDDYLKPDKWTTTVLPASRGQQWMFVVPVQLDGKNGIDLVAGSKNQGASLGWFEAPADARDANAWKYHKLRDAGWIMSILATDMDGDGRSDILFSDRKGKATGAFWLQNPGPGDAQKRPWPQHAIGGQGRECMFLDYADLDGDGRADIAMGAKDRDILLFGGMDARSLAWKASVAKMPETAGRAKGVAIGDIDLDGKADLVFSCESATPPSAGVMWMSCDGGTWTPHDVSGPEGVKFDLIVLVDLDNDGDLDILTCEEKQNLGLIWYENPFAGKKQPGTGAETQEREGEANSASSSRDPLCRPLRPTRAAGYPSNTFRRNILFARQASVRATRP